VTGDDDDPTAFARRFSPHSNAKLGGLPDGQSELRVLVATDVLSEGQNLQDARIVVNYDLPWATIRLVQRAGRVDRIGQESSEVLVYTFDVLDGLDGLLRLRRRLVRRLNEAGAVLGRTTVSSAARPIESCSRASTTRRRRAASTTWPATTWTLRRTRTSCGVLPWRKTRRSKGR